MVEDWLLFLEVGSDVAVKLAVSLICGFLLGIEREMKEKPAGLRTLILITMGATLFMVVSDLVARMTVGPDVTTRVDPSRIASQVVMGVGFIGGGAIIQSGGSIRGLTTAADIWIASGIGLLIGVGFPLLGIGVTLVVLLVLVLLNPLRIRLGHRGQRHEVRLVIPNDVLILQQVKRILESNDIPASETVVSRANGEALGVRFAYFGKTVGKLQLLQELASIHKLRGAPVTEGDLEGMQGVPPP